MMIQVQIVHMFGYVVAFIMQHWHLEKMCVQCSKQLLLKFKVKM
jgi:hypothetical protein